VDQQCTIGIIRIRLKGFPQVKPETERGYFDGSDISMLDSAGLKGRERESHTLELFLLTHVRIERRRMKKRRQS
jgi:hypothetical protein